MRKRAPARLVREENAAGGLRAGLALCFNCPARAPAGGGTDDAAIGFDALALSLFQSLVKGGNSGWACGGGESLSGKEVY